MSSPLSTLKKRHRAPLQSPEKEPRGRQTVPFRGDLVEEYQAALADGDVSSNSPITSRVSDAAPSKSKVPLNKGAPSDFELMSAMMQKVNLLEKKVRSQAQEIQRKDKKISVLEENLRRREESGRSRDLSGRDELESRCRQLHKQVRDMESFLNDYGLIWVGDGESSGSAESEQPRDVDRGAWRPGTSVVRNFNMNFDLVLRQIKDLNILAGEGESFVKPTATGARLSKKDPVRLRLYSNGILMFDGPFRSYQEPSAQRCMSDLMDGYFPSELQERFPDGVPFEVQDRRNEEFIVRQPWDRFPGKGQTVCGGGAQLSNVASSQVPGKELTVRQFLNRMPKVVVKAGRVIELRDSLRTAIQGSDSAQSSNPAILIDTPALQAMKERLQTFTSARNVVTVKVKSEDGNQAYVLKMCFSETIGHLRQYLDKHRGSVHPDYDVFSAYPYCRYDDDCQTLQSCGITTNAILLLRKRQHLTEVNKTES